jgi:uncharacterized protein
MTATTTLQRPREIAREGLARTATFRAVGDPTEGDGLTLDGYGAVFDSETLIDSWEGTFREVLARGCFKKSLRETRPRMQFDHGRHPLIGSIPIGCFDDGYPAEDDQGLRVVGRLMDNWLIQPVRDAIANGSIDGMSFRFSVVRETWTMMDGKKITDMQRVMELLWAPPDEGPILRTINEVKLSEVGPVVWPAYESTTVGVRSGEPAVIDLARLHEPATRTLLARAVLMVDAADGEGSNMAGPRTTSAPGRHPAAQGPAASDREAGEHSVPTPPGEPTRLRTDLSRWLSSRRVVIEHTERKTS